MIYFIILKREANDLQWSAVSGLCLCFSGQLLPYVNVHVCTRLYSQCLPCLTASVGCNWQSTGKDSSFQLMLETAAVAQGSRIQTMGLSLKVGKDIVSVADAQQV